MTRDQINAVVLALFASSGPVAKLMAGPLGLESQTIEAILSIASILTPFIIVPLFLRLMTPQAKVEAVANLSPRVAQDALQQVSDDAKVRIAEAVPGVETVVVANNASPELTKLAESAAHPNIVTASKNETDTVLGYIPKEDK